MFQDAKRLLILILVSLAVITFLSSAFIVKQTEQAIVLEFGKPKRTLQEPGLRFKLPFVQDVIFFEKRILDLDSETKEWILGDSKRLDVDAITRYRIVDPLLYYQKFPSGETAFKDQLNSYVNSSLFTVLGQYGLSDLLSEKRHQITKEIGQSVYDKMKPLGIELIDVIIKRAQLPEQNTEAVLKRMEKERERIAKQIRAEGDKESQEIRADADRLQTVILANAQKEGLILRGQGDEQASNIYATAFNIDPDFYQFYRSMQAYQSSLTDDQTTLVLSPKNPFFKYFNTIKTRTGGPTASKAEIERRLNDIEKIVESNEKQKNTSNSFDKLLEEKKSK